MEEKRPRIAEVYAGRSIFVTGFSGLMGKLLVEKLVWSCSDVDRIYVLLRGKRSLTCQQRLDKILNSEVFVRCREYKKNTMKKIVAVEGDVLLPGLGLSDDQRSLIINHVSIIFHCAASVKFDDLLPFALDINVKGTKTLVDLALEIKILDAFIHVSTAYSNCDSNVIEERMYPPKADWRKTLEIREKVDENLLNILCSKYINHMANTYVFTKSLAEQLINEYSDRLPMVIFRPSIVVPTLDEPFRGWNDSLNGPAALGVGIATGVLRSTLLDINIQPDFMPSDIAIKGLVVSAYERIYKRTEGLQLYNWCSKERSINYRQLFELLEKGNEYYPSKYMIWRPSFHTTNSFFIFYMNFLLFQLLPSFFLDFALWTVGQKPRLVKFQKKIYEAIIALSPFTLNFFEFQNTRSEGLQEIIVENDLPDFAYLRRTRGMDLENYVTTLNQFFFIKFFKMDEHAFDKARVLKNIMKWADVIIKTTFFVFLVLKIYTSNIIPAMFYSTINFFLNF